MAALNKKARWAMWSTVLALFVFPTACDTLSNPLEVEPASRIPAAQIESAQNAQILSDGAIGDFECAFNSYTVLGGVIGEEFVYAQQTASRAPYDRRNMTKDDSDYGVNSCTNNLGVYTPLQIARQSNENLLALLKTWTDAEVSAGAGSPNRTNLIGIAAAYAGYSYVLLGEGFCTMAISTVNLDKSLTYGGEIQRDSVFKLAIARFGEAITAATTANNTSIRNMAYLGRARARLDIGDYAGAKADAQQIPSGFLRVVSASDANARRQNRVAAENGGTINRTQSIADPYRNLNDTRVPVTATTLVSATGVTHYYQTKYPTTSTPLPLATYEEAQLIIAEADIRANSLATALPIINASRARGGQTVPFTGTTQAEYLAELIDQRRRELFLESHHLGDLIRYNLPFVPAAGTPYHFGGTYASQRCLPLPAAERLNNPLIGS
ncbi:MAG TPA: RagB/SusD family nutrient uptake outer membrane protein [Gemmatimonadaceae bacterium]|nr:RagB/SusD family nutrient uptake outer membrane protein [Gemmatimonadaceae bacterium]